MALPRHPAEPTPAERARSILASAASLTATTDDVRVEHLELRAVESTGRLLLAEPPGGCLSETLAKAPHRRLAATLEFTDVAPVAVRDRVRARLTLGGWLGWTEQLARSGRPLMAFHCALVAVTENGGHVHDVGLDELVMAEPDPLAVSEADLLTHLAQQHPEAVAALARLVDERYLLGVSRVQPLRVDRHGIVLRLECARSQYDARLPFRSALSHPDDAGLRIQELLAEAHVCRRRRQVPSRP